MKKPRLFSVGYVFPGGVAEDFPLDSDQSLLDADVVLFQPGKDPFYSHEQFNGRPLLTDSSSFAAVQAFARWKSELKAAVEAGKVVIVFLSKPQDVYVYTGTKTYSGTGKNARATNMVTSLSSYSSLPIDLTTHVAAGTGIVLALQASFLAQYWTAFSNHSRYEVTIEGKFSATALSTKAGERIVGALIRAKAGAILLLPPVRFDEEKFTKHNDDDGLDYWTAEAVTFGKKLAGELLAIAKSLQGSADVSPPPGWAERPDYRLQAEGKLQLEIAQIAKQLLSLQESKRSLEHMLAAEGGLRRLLYAGGKELEAAIIDALCILGFDVKAYKDSESEFDCIFEGPEGRFLGEAEGKDKTAVNIDKLSQLERNLQEDFARPEVDTFAKGVLFGNPQRLVPPEERDLTFTAKCLSGARRSGVALVLTHRLFTVAKYLKDAPDPEFARQCSHAIATTAGEIVVFPTPVGAPSSNAIAESPDSTPPDSTDAA